MSQSTQAVPHPQAKRGGATSPIRAPALPRANTGRRMGLYSATVLTLVVIAISRVHGFFPVLRAMRPAMVLVILAVAAAIVHPDRVETVNLRRSWHAKVFAAFLLVVCLSAVFGISPGRAGSFILSDYWKTVLIFPLLLLTIRSAADLRRLVRAMLVAAAFLVWLSVFVFRISKTQGSYTYDANGVGCVIVTILPLAILSLHAAKGWKERIFSSVLLGGMLITLVYSDSRGAFVGLMTVGVLMLVSLRAISLPRRLLTLALLAGGLALGAGQGYWKMMGSLQDPTADYNWSSPQGRKELALHGLGYLAGHPVFGIGIHNFPMAEVKLSPYARNFVDQQGMHLKESAAHNTPIEVAAELGVPGIVIWVMLWGGAFVICARERRRIRGRGFANRTVDDRFMYLTTYYVPLAVIGYLVTSFFLSFAYYDLTYVLLALVAAVPLAAERQRMAARRPVLRARQLRRQRLFPGTAR